MLNHLFKVNDDLLIHYGAGRDAYEEKPVNFGGIGEIRKYEITFAQHWQDYDFYNSEKLVDDFLRNVKHRVPVGRSTTRGENKFNIVCGFSIEKKQLSPFAANTNGAILNSRYWSTEPYETKSFNDFIYFSLKAHLQICKKLCFENQC